MRRLAPLVFIFLSLACQKKEVKVEATNFTMKGDEGREAVLYKVLTSADGKEDFFPYTKVVANQAVPLEPGNYLLANECASVGFRHQLGQESSIQLSKLKLVKTPIPSLVAANDAQEVVSEANKEAPEAKVVPDEIVSVRCFNPVERRSHQWTEKMEVDLFPGENRVWVGGRLFSIPVPLNEPVEQTINLFPVRVVAPRKGLDARVFFIADQKEGNNFVFQGDVEQRVWLGSGAYTVEVNGSRGRITVGRREELTVQLGLLRVETPKGFPMEERLAQGAHPIFAYLNEGVLLKLDHDYPMLPGTYTINIDGTDVKSDYEVLEKERTIVKTRGVVVEAPACPAGPTTCRAAPRITLHADKSPFVLKTVEPSVPFLVLEGAYEFGVEGTRGLLKTLQSSPEAVRKETLARVRVKWDVRPSTNRVRTDLVRFESLAGGTFGRSLDFLFSKPKEIYVPAGHYHLTYFVGDPAQERVKTKVELLLGQGETREITVPIYTDKTPQRGDLAAGGRGERENTELEDLPSTLQPVRR